MTDETLSFADPSEPLSTKLALQALRGEHSSVGVVGKNGVRDGNWMQVLDSFLDEEDAQGIERLLSMAGPASASELAIFGLKTAVRARSFECLDVLLGACAPKGDDFAEKAKNEALWLALNGKDPSCVKSLVLSGKVNLRERIQGRTPLLHAVSMLKGPGPGQEAVLDCLRLLAPVGFAEEQDRTYGNALMVAAHNNHLLAVEILRPWTALDAVNIDGHTALMCALLGGEPDPNVIRCLLSASNVSFQTPQAETAWSMAIRGGSWACADEIALHMPLETLKAHLEHPTARASWADFPKNWTREERRQLAESINVEPDWVVKEKVADKDKEGPAKECKARNPVLTRRL